MVIIGIDCATKEGKTGLALGSVRNKQVLIKEVTTGSKVKTSVDTVSKWLSENQPALLAFDAPLGWPMELSRQLMGHVAGQSLRQDPKFLFSRETDRFVQGTLNKKPLEVGANYIARTAHSALKLLNDLRQQTGLTIPLAWEMGKIEDTCAIEVYPAGTLKAKGLESPKKDDKFAKSKRVQLLKRLHIDIGLPDSEEVIENSNAFDAIICVLAAWDFLLGKCIPIPAHKIEQARKEGWIWVTRSDVD